MFSSIKDKINTEVWDAKPPEHLHTLTQSTEQSYRGQGSSPSHSIKSAMNRVKEASRIREQNKIKRPISFMKQILGNYNLGKRASKSQEKLVKAQGEKE